MVRLIAVAAAALVCGVRPAHAAADVGEKAPEIAVSEWIQGDPLKVADGAGSRTLLIVFWRTFCDSMGDALSRLDALQKERKDKPFDVVALTTEPADLVRTYIAYHKVDLRIGIDQFHAAQDAYLKKDDKQMPIAWLVDKTGVIVWKGSPWGCSGMVDKVLAGTFDLAKAKQNAAREERMWTAYEAEDWATLATESESVLASDPNHERAFDFRLRAFREKGDRAGYQKFMKAYVEKGKDDAAALVRASNQLLTQPGEKFLFRSFTGFFRMVNRRDPKDDWREVDLAFSTAKRAVEASKSADTSALGAYVNVLATVGLLEEAIEQQKKLVALDAKNSDNAKYLAYLEACLAARKKATAK
jgi:tetratricopeptide (TPR) repeat protein